MTDTVVLLTLDAARADHCSFLGYDRETTPRLADLVREGRLFANCTAQSSHTRESMPSMLHSLYPAQLERVGVAPERPSVAELFADAGFATAGFHSNPYLSRSYGFDTGFDTFDDDLPRFNNRIVTFLHRVRNYFQAQPYVTAESLIEKGRDWLATTNADRRFLWLHFMDPHGPYQPPADTQQLFRDSIVDKATAKSLWRRSVDEPETLTADERETLVDLYDAELRYTDEVLGTFVSELRAEYDDPLIAIGSDHGDAFGEHDLFGHPRQLYEELVHVPLVLLGGGVPADERVDSPVANVDILPTLLDGAGITVPEHIVGRSLLTDGIEDRELIVFTEATAESAPHRRWAARSNEYKYFVETDDDGSVIEERLWALEDDESGQEMRDLTDTSSEVRDRFAAALDAHLEAVASSRAGLASEPETVDSAVKERLQDLGYR